MSQQKAPKLITIIIPCYNIEPYIRPCLHSIMEQNIIKRCQVLCIDDGCTDGTTKHLERYAKKNPEIITVLDRKTKRGIKNGGVSAARNLGLDNTIGQTVMFVDGDDIIGGIPEFLHHVDHYYLEKFYDALMSQPNTAMIIGKMDYIDSKCTKIIPTKRFDALNDRLSRQISKIDQQLDFLDLRISSCNTLYRTDIINKPNDTDCLRFNPNMMYFEDADFVMKYAFRALGEKYKCILNTTEKPVYYFYRNRPHSAMHKLSPQHSESTMRCFDRTKKRLEYYANLINLCEINFGTSSRMYNIAAHRYANKTASDIIKYSAPGSSYKAEYDSLLDFIPDNCSHDCVNNDCGNCGYQYKLKYLCNKLITHTR